jgi:PAS domain S-box-containing protein
VLTSTTASATPTPTHAGADPRMLSQLKYALDQAAIVAITDRCGVITHVNDKFCEISRYDREELLGRDHRIINSGHHPKAFMRELWHTIAQGRIWRGEIRNRAKDGTLYWVDTTIVPFLDDAGRPHEYLAIRYDITERKAAEARLREQAALAQLGELAAIVAHEVRNPLAGIRGSLQVLATRLPEMARERQIVGTMVERIDALAARVRDILLFAGSGRVRLQPVTVGPILADVAAAAAAAVPGASPIELACDPVVVVADPELLRELLLNLAMNACQASTGGAPIEVTVTAAGDQCRIAIADRGPGIPSEIRHRVFEPFFTTKHGGTGLGLAIVKRLADVQAGTVCLEDRPGGGTTATVQLPLHRR